MKYSTLLILIFSIIFCNCKTSQNMTYQYADGSGNAYIINTKTIQYKPIKAKESSSGEYSGGNDAIINITEENFKEIQIILEKAIHNKAIHIENRVMMSGLIVIVNNNNTKTIIIKPKCVEQSEIENYLLKIFHKQ